MYIFEPGNPRSPFLTTTNCHAANLDRVEDATEEGIEGEAANFLWPADLNPFFGVWLYVSYLFIHFNLIFTILTVITIVIE